MSDAYMIRKLLFYRLSVLLRIYIHVHAAFIASSCYDLMIQRECKNKTSQTLFVTYLDYTDLKSNICTDSRLKINFNSRL